MEREEFLHTLSTHPLHSSLYQSYGEYLNSEICEFGCPNPLHIADLLTYDISTPEAPFFVEVEGERDLICYDPEDTGYHIGTLRRVEICDYSAKLQLTEYTGQYLYICDLDEDIINC